MASERMLLSVLLLGSFFLLLWRGLGSTENGLEITVGRRVASGVGRTAARPERNMAMTQWRTRLCGTWKPDRLRIPRFSHKDMLEQSDGSSFVNTEMRRAAMKLHTKEQMGDKGSGKSVARWEFNLEGAMQFLVDSKAVYEALGAAVGNKVELEAISRASKAIDRVPRIDADIQKIATENQDLKIPEPRSEALKYAKNLREMAQRSVPAFMCHFYNVHFAHAAGGRMIGKMIADRLFDGEALEFYKYDGEPKALLGVVRKEIDNLAQNWTLEEKEACLSETGNAFSSSGALLSNLQTTVA